VTEKKSQPLSHAALTRQDSDGSRGSAKDLFGLEENSERKSSITATPEKTDFTPKRLQEKEDEEAITNEELSRKLSHMMIAHLRHRIIPPLHMVYPPLDEGGCD